MKILHNFLILCDITEHLQTGIQDPATPALEGTLNFHNYLIIFCIIIGVVIFFLLYWIIFHFNKDLNENIKPVQFTHSNVLKSKIQLLKARINEYLKLSIYINSQLPQRKSWERILELLCLGIMLIYTLDIVLKLGIGLISIETACSAEILFIICSIYRGVIVWLALKVIKEPEDID
jgi:hypothetical protein